MVKREYGAKMEGSRAMGKPKMRLMVSVERKGMNIDEARMCVQDCSEWRRAHS
jgi:hypothetical protein